MQHLKLHLNVYNPSWDNMAPVMEVLMVAKAKETYYLQGEIGCN
jgi:predicted FMN-binding regulatory protein PaiB